MKKIFRYYSQKHFSECMVDENHNILGVWHENDAQWRGEYFNNFMEKLGIEVSSMKGNNSTIEKNLNDMFGVPSL